MDDQKNSLSSTSFTAREYQVELFEKAMKRNCIVLLGTGSGKTFIAAMLIKELSSEVRIPYEDGGKRTFFIVDRVELVIQQAECIRRHTGLTVGEYYGEKMCDAWRRERWEHELKQNQVFVMTGEICRMVFDHGFFDIKRANVIIFDECHKASGNHPYARIMIRYQESLFHQQTTSSQIVLPRILGLTPSLINGNKKSGCGLKKAINDLETTLDSCVITAKNLKNVHRTRPKKELHARNDVWLSSANRAKFIDVFRYLNYDDPDSFWKSFSPSDDTVVADSVAEVLKRARTVFEQLGPWCCLRVVEKLASLLDQYYELMKTAPQEDRLIILYGRTQLNRVAHSLNNIMGNPEPNLMDVMKYWLPHRFRQTLLILDECRTKFGKAEEFSGIIFVNERYIAKTLKEMIEAIRDKLKYEGLNFLRVEYVVGSSAPSMSEDELDMSPSRRLHEVMRDFRQKNINLLVATNVLEEGVDVPHCSCIIHLDPPKNFTSYVQAQGRARKEGSVYYILAEGDEAIEMKSKLRRYDNTELEIYNPKNYSNYRPVVKEQFDAQLADKLDPPFFPPVPDDVELLGKPKADMTNAVVIVNRYCANLPGDVFTRILTKYKVSILKSADGTEMYQGYVTLPLNSPIKDPIYGKRMPTRRYARMSTALAVCKKLFEKGELTYHLLPIRENALEEYLMDELNAEPDDRAILESEGKCGTKRRRHFYPRKIASALVDAGPKSGQLAYVYLFDMVPVNDSLNRIDSVGIISSKRLPKLPQFPIYGPSGQHDYNVDVSCVDIIHKVMKQDLELMSKFHTLVFTEILNFRNSVLTYDLIKAGNTLFIVPLTKKGNSSMQYEIDLKFIRNTFDAMPKLETVPSDSERLNFSFEREKYADAVVLPWHKTGDEQRLFFVKEICDNLVPTSFLPNSERTTFVSFYYDKYKIRIFDWEQPLLHCCGKGFKAITPNYYALRRTTGTPSLEPDENQPVEPKVDQETLEKKSVYRPYFIPELVHVHPIPASMWNAFTMVPFTLHRIETLLLAMEWGHRVEKEAFGRTQLVEDDKPAPIIYKCGDDFEEMFQFEPTDSQDSKLSEDSDLTSDDEEQSNTTNWNANFDEMILPSAFTDDDTDDSLDDEDDNSNPTVLPDSVFVHSTPIRPLDLVSQFDVDHFAERPHGPRLGTLLSALTLLNADDGSNLERLETVGDSFLKFAVSEYLYNVFDDFHEGKLSFLKSRLISNRNLFHLGIRRELTDYMTANKFQPYGNWIPPGYVLASDSDLPDGALRRYNYQVISDKSVADCVEATIGVYVLTYGRKSATQYLKWLGIGVKPKKEDEGVDLWSKRRKAPLLLYVDDPMNDLRRLWSIGNFKQLEIELGYEFKDKAYLVQALTHPSYYTNRVTDCYQPLEFLGDAVLDYLITNVLFQDKRQFGPGVLTDLRSALVNNTLFAALAVKHKFHFYLLQYCPMLASTISDFVEVQESRQFEVNFNELLSLFVEDEGEVAEVEVPKALGDIFESVAGAIYLDSGGSLDMVWSVYSRMFDKQIEKCCANPPKSPIRELMECFPQQINFVKLETPPNTMVKTKSRVGVIIAGLNRMFIGAGRNMRMAKNTAAKRALKFSRYSKSFQL